MQETNYHCTEIQIFMYQINDYRDERPHSTPNVYDRVIVPEKRRDLNQKVGDNFEDELTKLFNGMKPLPCPADSRVPYDTLPDDDIVHYDGIHAPHIHCDEPRVSVLKLVYGYDNIYEEVYKRTSFLAKNRPTEALVHQLNAMSFTRDEEFMFKPFILEAASNVFEKLAPFCKNIQNAFRYNEHVVTYERERIPNIKDFLEVGMPCNIHAEQVQHDDACGSIYEISFDVPIAHFKPIDCAKYGVRMRIEIDYTTRYYGETVRNTGIIETKFSTRKSVVSIKQQVKVKENVYGETIETFECVNDVRVSRYGLIRKTDKKPERWAAGNYVELTDGNDKHLFRILKDTFSNADLHDQRLFEAIETDDRDSVIFTLQILEWMDENAFRGLDNAVFESIVNFVMYKWFLIVAPTEAEGYYNAYDQALTRVTYRANQQKKPIHRHYHLF